LEQLEYRLLKDDEDFDILYHYELDDVEAAARKMSEFYVKDNTVFQTVSVAKEPLATAIYVKEFSSNTPFTDEKTYSGINLEIRKFNNIGDSPLLKTIENTTHLEVLRHFQSDFIYIPMKEEKFLEYKLVSTEIDEQRNTYVYYCEPTHTMLRY